MFLQMVIAVELLAANVTLETLHFTVNGHMTTQNAIGLEDAIALFALQRNFQLKKSN